jgi:hypothetical protein
MNFYNDINNYQENIIDKYKKNEEKTLDNEQKDLYNLFGYIPKKYIKFFNVLILEVFTTLFFAFIYYILLVTNFDGHFFIPIGFDQEKLWQHKWFVAIYMSINFQSTTAYVDIKCKSLLVKSLILMQIIITVAIAFFFITT